MYQIKKLITKSEIKCLRNAAQYSFSKRFKSKYFLTTPIFYVNADPHIGHLFTAALGDAISRFQKLKNPGISVKFMVGTDEHGLKVSQSAKNLNINPKVFCDTVSQKYKSLFSIFNIESDDFVRTTEERHFQTATALWNKLISKNLIYKDDYSGWYCLSDEVFVSEKFLEPENNDNNIRYTLDGRKPVHFVTETNYKFKLSKFQYDLLSWLNKGDVIKPKKYQNILYKWIEDGEALNDISISRPVERVSWGIPVPEDSSQTMYVWFDALSSYLCTSGYPNSVFKWPPDVQIIGKDILRFHGIFWPAFLMAADLEPPNCILCHSHWLRDNEKISKSKGNVIDPFKEAKKYTNDGFRYFLLREGVPHSDGNFTNIKVQNILNSELADSLGNLLSRCTGSAINPKQVFPKFIENDFKKFNSDNSEQLIASLKELPGQVETHFEEFNFYKGIDAIVATVHLTNKYFHAEKPWELKKCSEKMDHLNLVLHLTMESLRVCGILLQPIIPNIAYNLLNKLSIDKSNRYFHNIRPFSWESSQSSNCSLQSGKVILFSKVKALG